MSRTYHTSLWLLCLLIPAQAAAIPIVWTLHDVAFSDGGTGSGSFVYDADTNIYSAIDITTTAGTVRPGNIYAARNTLGGASVSSGFVAHPAAAADFTGVPFLSLQFAFSLTNDALQTGITGFREGICSNVQCSFSRGAFRTISAGTVRGSRPSAIPEPGGLALAIVALVTAAGFRSRCTA